MSSPAGAKARSGDGDRTHWAARFDPFIVVALGLGLLLYAPLIPSGLPQAPDGILHFYRTALWRWAWNDGVLWPRWDTLLFQGYGYPVLSFNGPLPYVVAVLLSYITPTLEGAYKGMLLLACLGYSVGMYLWARDFLGRWGALVAAAAFTFAPFRYRELFFLGGYCQFFAWSLYPWILFFFHRLAKQRGRGPFVGAVFFLSALLLSHNISAVLFAVFLGPYLLALLIGYRRLGALRRLVAAGACVFCISAVFILPALLEQSYTQVDLTTTGYWDISHHMLRVADFFAASGPLDSRAALPALPFNYGRWALALAGLGALSLALRGQGRQRRLHVAFGLFVMLGASFMMLPASLPVWRAVPLLDFTEYAFRMYGCASLGSALLAGAAVAWVEKSVRARAVAVSGAVVGLIVAVAVYQYPRPYLKITPTPASFLAYERDFRALGTSGGGEFLSRDVMVPPVTAAIGPGLERVALADAPAGVSGEVVRATTDSLDIALEAAGPATVRLAQFYFPGWRGWLDGAPVALRSAEGVGLIQVEVPAGQHELRLQFGDTPVRAAGRWLSLAGLLAAVVLAWRVGPGRGDAVAAGRAVWGEAGLYTGVLAAWVLAAGVWIGPHTTWFRLASPPSQAAPAQHHTDLAVGDGIAIIGYDVDKTTVRQGEEIHVRLYWQATGRPQHDYASFVQLGAGRTGSVFAQSDNVHAGGIPTTTWTREQYVVDDHRIEIPDDAPPVALKIVVGLYKSDDLQRLDSVELPDVVHVLARQEPAAAAMDRGSASVLGDGIRLLGHHVEQGNGVIRVTLYWRADKAQTADYQVFVHAQAPGMDKPILADGPPVGGLYLTSAWLPGQVIADTHVIRLPDGVAPTSLQFGLYDRKTLQRLPATKPDGSRWLDDAVVIDEGL